MAGDPFTVEPLVGALNFMPQTVCTRLVVVAFYFPAPAFSAGESRSSTPAYWRRLLLWLRWRASLHDWRVCLFSAEKFTEEGVRKISRFAVLISSDRDVVLSVACRDYARRKSRSEPLFPALMSAFIPVSAEK